MRKLNYQDLKLQELLEVLEALGFTWTKQKDSIDINVSRESRKILNHELSRINGLHKTPPLATQFDEALGIVSVFDSRL